MAQAHTEPDTAGTITLRYADPQRALAGVRLVQEIGLPAALVDFVYQQTDRVWHLRLPPVPVWRLEYRLELRHRDGRAEVICDPDNPHRAPGAFGEKSVLELPGYRRPGWLDLPTAPGPWRELTVGSRAIRADLPVRIWSPAAAERLAVAEGPAVMEGPSAAETPAPARGILLAHDGGEFDRLAGLAQYSAAMTKSGGLPRHHLVLLSPVERNDWYSANPAYARALVDEVLPTVRAELGSAAPVVAVGASLGALALLHAQRLYPRAFAGLFLQSGSFFQERFDAQESSFPRYRRIVRFVGELRRQRPAGFPVPTVLTCGVAEENLANNRDMAGVLHGQGYPVRLVEVPDAHNFVAWRDAWHPYLAELASRVWTAGTAGTPAGYGAFAAGLPNGGG